MPYLPPPPKKLYDNNGVLSVDADARILKSENPNGMRVEYSGTEFTVYNQTDPEAAFFFDAGPRLSLYDGDDNPIIQIDASTGCVLDQGAYYGDGSRLTNVAGDDTAYNATTWDGSTAAPTQNAVRDKIESIETEIAAKAASGANTDITSVALNQTGLKVKGGSANKLNIKPNETLTAERILNVKVNDADRTVDLSGNLTVPSTASVSGTNTGDQTSVSGNAGTATALQTARTIDGQSFDGSANITVIAPGTHAATSKATPVDADEVPLVDSAASNVLKKLTWSNLKATLKTYFDSLYQAAGSYLTSGGALGTPSSGTLTNCTGLPEGGLSTTDITTGDVSTSKHGFAPKAPNDTSKFLRGDATWAAPSGGGKVLQIVFASKTDTATTTSTSFVSVFSAAITPTSSSSKILVMITGAAASTNGYEVFLRVTRAGTAMTLGDTAGSRTRCLISLGVSSSTEGQIPFALHDQDSPATTSSTTYQMEWCVESGGTAYLNQSRTDSNTAPFPRSATTMILMEIQ